MACLLLTVLPPAILNILAYPVSHNLSVKISDYIVKVCAPRVFAILSTYKKFKFLGDKKSKELLPEQFLVISNHQSLMDIPLFMNYMRNKDLRFVAKDELARHVPLVSEMLRTHEHCMIPRRGSPVVAMRTMENFGKRVIERNQIPIIFPEGTRSRDGNVGKFYAAGFRKIAETVKLPVAVVALDGGWKISQLGGILRNLYQGSYKIKVLKVYDAPSSKEESTHILDEGRELIVKQLEEWRKANNK
ncbi:MAG: 1-acyl-sn-glycerol-3-phosphate acyltransferase [Treponema sp.]|nr:1-acyl-sn-glycerol-3-phosphate acyltransferase [Treponema sp.]